MNNFVHCVYTPSSCVQFDDTLPRDLNWQQLSEGGRDCYVSSHLNFELPSVNFIGMYVTIILNAVIV
jgi:hypothetical protein